MKKALFIISVALLCGCTAWAQDPATQQPPDQQPSSQQPATQQPSSQPSTSEPSSPSSPSSTTDSQKGSIQGCLSGSTGNYVLTQDNTGSVVRLTGADDKLKDHVGHEVQLTGQFIPDSSGASPGNPSDQRAAGTAETTGSAAGSQKLQVSDVRMVSEQCGSASTGASNPSSGASTTSADTTSSGRSSLSQGATPSPDTGSSTSMGQDSATPTTSSAGAAATGVSMSNPGSSASAAAPAESGSSMASSASSQSQPSTESAQPQTGQESGVRHYSDMDSKAGNDTNASNRANAANRAGAEPGNLPSTASGLPLLVLLGVTFVATGVAGGNWRKPRMPNINEGN